MTFPGERKTFVFTGFQDFPIQSAGYQAELKIAHATRFELDKCLPLHIEVEIRVSDNGIGFDLDQTERIFHPFQRLVGRSEYKGTGVGLAICRKIIERHQGSITAESEPGQGAVFIVQLPVRHPKEK